MFQPTMRALNSSNTPSNITSTSPSHPKDSSVSALASQFMDMFDPSKLDNTLLNKRPNPNLDHFELQKKLKTHNIWNSQHGQLPQNNMASLLFQQNMFNGLNFPVNNLTMNDGFSQDFAKLQQLQNLNLLLNLNKSQYQQQQIPTANPSLFTNPFLNKDGLGSGLMKNFENSQQQVGLKIKEEFIKEEESVQSITNVLKKLAGKTAKPAPKEEVESSSTCTNEEKDEEEEQSVKTFIPSNKEPALVLYTEAFPDWDLATIFMFLKSNKPQDVFEKERQIKLERKLKRRSRGERKEKAVKAKKPSKYDDLPKNSRVTRRMQGAANGEAGQVGQQVQA